MPKVTMNYARGYIPRCNLLPLGKAIQRIVAAAMSTSKTKLEECDIDWIPLKLPSEAIAQNVSIEIETYGYQERKEKINNLEYQLKFKDDIVIALNQFAVVNKVNRGDKFIWIKYVDPDGPHF